MGVNIAESSKERIVIIGGGFGGLEIARRLVRLDYQVVLIDKNNYHQFQTLFYQVATSGLEPSSIVFPFRKNFQKKKNFHFLLAEVESVDADRNCIQTQGMTTGIHSLEIQLKMDHMAYTGTERVLHHWNKVLYLKIMIS